MLSDKVTVQGKMERAVYFFNLVATKVEKGTRTRR
jgi:hypothetical protein